MSVNQAVAAFKGLPFSLAESFMKLVYGLREALAWPSAEDRSTLPEQEATTTECLEDAPIMTSRGGRGLRATRDARWAVLYSVGFSMQTAAIRSSTLVDIIVPGRGLRRDLVLVVAFSLMVGLFAQIAIRLPFTTVPITGQTLAVLVTGGALGSTGGAGALGLYAVCGTLGLPVFAPGSNAMEGQLVHFILPWSGTSAPIWLLPSGGYIVGFILAALTVGRLCELGWDRRWSITALDKTLVGGLYPFIPGDLAKLLVASVVLPGAWTLAGRHGPGGRTYSLAPASATEEGG